MGRHRITTSTAQIGMKDNKKARKNEKEDRIYTYGRLECEEAPPHPHALTFVLINNYTHTSLILFLKIFVWGATSIHHPM